MAGPQELQTREALPAERLAIEAALGPGTWPPGRTFVAVRSGERVGVVRLGDAPPGDGYHREHVRSLHLSGEATALPALARAAVEAAGPNSRLECVLGAERRAETDALEAAGLVLEGRAADGLRRAGASIELQWWGRPGGRMNVAVGSLPPPPQRWLQRRSGPKAGHVGTTGEDAVRVEVHGKGTRARLAAFLQTLVPGRSYPPGTLLSEAELVETRRPGDLDAPSLLATARSGEVVGALVFEGCRDPERSHVRRVHLDVREDARGRGLGAILLRAARAHAGQLGATLLEADPLAGNVGVLRALERAGFRRSGAQVGAWRLRTATSSWLEDVSLFHADVFEPA